MFVSLLLRQKLRRLSFEAVGEGDIDDNNESPAETVCRYVLHLCFSSYSVGFPIHKQELVIITKILRSLFALTVAVFSYWFLKCFNYNYVVVSFL